MLKTLLLLHVLWISHISEAACPYLRRQLQGGGGDGANAIIQQLFDNHLLMERSVTYNDDDTISTRTTSSTPFVATLLQQHVSMMQTRAENDIQVRPWDPFFVELFERHEEINVQVTNITDGVEVYLSATTDCGQALIEDHTTVVTLFVETGREEGRKEHAVPEDCLAAVQPPPPPSTTEPTTAAPVVATTSPPTTEAPVVAPTSPPTTAAPVVATTSPPPTPVVTPATDDLPTTTAPATMTSAAVKPLLVVKMSLLGLVFGVGSILL